jgi:hypothetical protein
VRMNLDEELFIIVLEIKNGLDLRDVINVIGTMILIQLMYEKVSGWR